MCGQGRDGKGAAAPEAQMEQVPAGWEPQGYAALRGEKANRDEVFKWFSANYETIVSRIPPMAAAFCAGSSSANSGLRVAS